MKTEATNINELLRLFYEGKTSPGQERELHCYFATTETIPDELLADKKVFQNLSSLSGAEDNNIDIPQGFDERLEALFGDLTEKEKKKPAPVFRLWKQAAGIAASIAMVLSASLFFGQSGEHQPLTDTYTSPEDAYIEAQHTLLLVSERMNEGFSRLEKADEDLSKTNEILYKKLNFSGNEKFNNTHHPAASGSNNTGAGRSL